MRQMPDAKDGASRYEAGKTMYVIRHLPTPRMGEDRWHWMVEGESMREGAAGHATKRAAVEDLEKFLRLIT